VTHKLESYLGIAKQFKMELRCFSREDFFDRVAEIWNKSVLGQNSVQRWNRKMGALGKHLPGWAAHTHGEYKQHKNPS